MLRILTRSPIPVHAQPLIAGVESMLAKVPRRPGPFVVGISGGPDSVALLLALHQLAQPLLAVHVNHCLRGVESDGDQAFVAELCRDRGIELVVERVDIRAEAAASGANLEATARRVRYAIFARVAKECGAAAVATGHTADDQAETVLHHLLRGTGLRGLRGIAMQRPMEEGIELIRPLLGVSRALVIDYLEAVGVVARQDSTNEDRALTRNRIRHELLPRLRAEYNPQLTEHLCQLADQAQVLYGELEVEARRQLAIIERPRAGSVVVLDAVALRAVPRHLAREVFHLIWEREGWQVGAMNFAHWQRLADLLDVDEGAHDLPDRVAVRRKGRVLQLRRME